MKYIEIITYYYYYYEENSRNELQDVSTETLTDTQQANTSLTHLL